MAASEKVLGVKIKLENQIEDLKAQVKEGSMDEGAFIILHWFEPVGIVAPMIYIVVYLL